MSRSSMGLKTKVLLISLIVVTGITLIVSLLFLNKPKELDINFPEYDEKLSPKISTYLLENDPGVLRHYTYDEYGNLLSGQSDKYCDVSIYGYDEKYIYSFVVCQEHGWLYHYDRFFNDENAVEITCSLQSRGGGWSHMRFKYNPGTDFEIIGYERLCGDSTYYEDLEEMFAPMGIVGWHDVQETQKKLQERFYEEHNDDPYLGSVKEAYGVKKSEDCDWR